MSCVRLEIDSGGIYVCNCNGTVLKVHSLVQQRGHLSYTSEFLPALPSRVTDALSNSKSKTRYHPNMIVLQMKLLKQFSCTVTPYIT